MGGPPALAQGDLKPLLEISTQGSSEKQHQADWRAWCVKHWLKPRTAGWSKEPWGAEASAFAEKALAVADDQGTRGAEIAALADQADKLMAAGCQDPLACWLAWLAHGSWRQGEAALDRALQHAADPGVPGTLLAAIAESKVKLEGEMGAGSPEWAAHMAQGLKQALEEGAFDEKSAPLLLRQYRRCLGWLPAADVAALESLREAGEKAPMPEWAKLSLLGGTDIELAGRKRLSVAIRSAGDPAFQEFMARLNLAREELEKAWKLQPGCPEAATMMMAVCMWQGSGAGDVLTWFKRATEVEFDLPEAYSKMTYALGPKLGGTHGLMIRFALAAAQTRRFDTEVPAVLWKVCEFVARASTNPQSLYSDPEVRAALVAVHEGYLAEKGSDEALKRHASMAAAAAQFMGDSTLVARALAVAGDSLAPPAVRYLNSLGLSENRLRLESRAAQGEFGPEVAALLDPKATRNEAEFNKKLEAIKPEALAPAAAGLVADMRLLLGINSQLEQGAWVALPFHPGLSLFHLTGGRCSAIPEGDLVLEGDDDQAFTEIVLRQPLPIECEIRGEFEISIPEGVKTRRMTLAGPELGFQFAPEPDNPQPVERGVVLINKGAASAEGQITGATFMNRRPRSSAPLNKVNHFHLGIFDAEATFDMNGTAFALEDSLAHTALTNQVGMAGFCTRNLPAGGRIVLRHLEIRKATKVALRVGE